MSISELLIKCEQARSLETFESCVDFYNNSTDLQDRQNLMSKLLDTYYLPFEGRLRECYEKNLESLAAYPYIWDKNFTSFADLSFRLFYINDECYYLYDKIKHRFVGKYDGITRHQMRYFFKNLDQAIKVVDEDSLYNLTFLFDNVRCSEDVAMDNHIYLLYSSWQPLQRAMQMGEFTPILEHEKFVFLIGEKNHSQYPVDFKGKYGIDYSQMTPQRLRIEDLNRIYLNHFYPWSGNLVLFDFLNVSDYVLSVCVGSYILFLKGYVADKLKLIKAPEIEVNVQDFLDSARKHISEVPFEEWGKVLHYLPKVLEWRKTITIYQLVKAVFLAAIYYAQEVENRQFETRITPVIFLDPHTLVPYVDCHELIKYFKYHALVSVFRNPLDRLLCYSSKGLGVSAVFVKLVVGSIYAINKFIPKWLANDGYYFVRSEDLKLKTEQTMRAVCRVFNIPFSKRLLAGKSSEFVFQINNENGEQLHGCDIFFEYSVNDEVLTPYDRERLSVFYWPILSHFGYTDEPCPKLLTKEETVQLFSKPFLFEEKHQEKRMEIIEALENASGDKYDALLFDLKFNYGVDGNALRVAIKEAMVEYYCHGFNDDFIYPEIIWPEEEGYKEVSQAERLNQA